MFFSLSLDNLLELTRGRAYPITAEVADEDGTPHVWAAGAKATMYIKRNPDDTAPRLTVAGDISDTGLAVFELHSWITAELDAGMMWYEISVTEYGEKLSLIPLSPMAVLANGSD